MLKTIIVDDEPLAHDVLLNYAQNVPFIEIVGQCYNATEALGFVHSTSIDLMLLDINMPVLSGMELLKILSPKPQVIITSAYQEHALKSFELDVTDYLLKPFSFERFLQASNKVLKQHNLTKQTLIAVASSFPPAEHIFMKVDKKQVRFALAHISCFESYGNYVKVWKDGKSQLTPRTLTSFEQQLADSAFIRIHKTVIVNKHHIDSVEPNQVTLSDGQTYPIGKSYKETFNHWLKGTGHSI